MVKKKAGVAKAIAKVVKKKATTRIIGVKKPDDVLKIQKKDYRIALRGSPKPLDTVIIKNTPMLHFEAMSRKSWLLTADLDGADRIDFLVYVSKKGRLKVKVLDYPEGKYKYESDPIERTEEEE